MIESKEEAERYLRDRFEQTLPAQVDRYLQARVHEIIPGQFFSSASAECREMFVTAHYYGCVSLAQSVAEGLSIFLALVNRQRKTKDPKVRVERLATAGIISSASRDSFMTIWGDDRNDYHHLNRLSRRTTPACKAGPPRVLRHFMSSRPMCSRSTSSKARSCPATGNTGRTSRQALPRPFSGSSNRSVGRDLTVSMWNVPQNKRMQLTKPAQAMELRS